MDGISAIESRIATIQARFGAPPPVTPRNGLSTTEANPSAWTPTATQSLTALSGGQPIDGFGAALQSAMGGSQALTPALRLAPGSYGSLEPPAELVHYGNGRIPAEALEPLGIGNHRLHAPAAGAFRQMMDAAKADGVDIGITDSYRDLATQESLAARKGLYSQGGLAARPGTSNHGWGLSVDLDLDNRAQEWMRANGPRFGFVEDVPREPWHWTYRPA